jgi:hypothetical protein
MEIPDVATPDLRTTRAAWAEKLDRVKTSGRSREQLGPYRFFAFSVGGGTFVVVPDDE